MNTEPIGWTRSPGVLPDLAGRRHRRLRRRQGRGEGADRGSRPSSSTSSSCSSPTAPARCWSSSRAWTPRARTAPSSTSSRWSTRRASRSPASSVPTTTSSAHDYLWRVHHNTPGDGDITIFNRSHYEDVLVVRVHDLVPKRCGSSATSTSATSSRCWPTRARSSGSSSCTSRRTSSASASRSGSTTPEELEVRARRPRGAQALGRVHRGVRGGALETSTKTRPGTSCRRPEVVPQPGGLEILVETLESLDMGYPEPAPGLDKIVIDD